MSHDTSPQTDAAALSDLTDRLRGIYRIPVNDGAGPLNGSMVFERRFETPRIHHEAADTIDRLTRELAAQAAELALATATCRLSKLHTDALESERDTLRRALEWFVNLGHGVGKAGGTPEADEFEAAIAAGEAALSKQREPEAARTERPCVCGHPESDHETIEYRGDKSRSCVENRQGPSAERCPCMCYQPAAPEPKEP
jgi:hypothetical protein